MQATCLRWDFMISLIWAKFISGTPRVSRPLSPSNAWIRLSIRAWVFPVPRLVLLQCRARTLWLMAQSTSASDGSLWLLFSSARFAFCKAARSSWSHIKIQWLSRLIKYNWWEFGKQFRRSYPRQPVSFYEPFDHRSKTEPFTGREHRHDHLTIFITNIGNPSSGAKAFASKFSGHLLCGVHF